MCWRAPVVSTLPCVSQVLQTLGTETYRPSSASQCVAGIACAEIPVNQWPELILQLVENVTNPSSTEHMKESTLEAIGYICQDIVSVVFLPPLCALYLELFSGLDQVQMIVEQLL